jgi:hypothetical protein
VILRRSVCYTNHQGQKILGATVSSQIDINLAIGETEKRFVNRIQKEIIKLAREINEQFSGPGNQFGGSTILDPLMIEVETHLGEAVHGLRIETRWRRSFGSFHSKQRLIEFRQARRVVAGKRHMFDSR